MRIELVGGKIFKGVEKIVGYGNRLLLAVRSPEAGLYKTVMVDVMDVYEIKEEK